MSKGTRNKQNRKTAGLQLLIEFNIFKDHINKETEN